MPAVAEELDDPFDVQRDGEQRLDGVDLEPAGGQLGHRGERRAPGQSACALRPPLLARVDQGHDLDVGVVDVGAHVEVVDAAEADEGGPDGRS